jgi:flagellar basal-body rod protein FlgF
MIRGLYTAASALIMNLRQQELVANNIANIATTGYKGETSAGGAFASVLATSVGNAAVPVPLSLRRTLGTVGTGTYLAERTSYLNDGELLNTELPLDLALRGSGFFALQGPTGTLYTRDGHFRRSPDGFLASASGLRVLGADGEPIALATADVDAIRVTVSGDILLGDEAVGRLQIVDIPPAQLVRAGETSFVSAGIVTPAGAGGSAVLVQGALEESNIDMGRAATQLAAVSQQFAANQRVFLMIDENLQRAVTEIGRVG